jgi:heme/copper-type cytochrome/quinol oxidase subunit 1
MNEGLGKLHFVLTFIGTNLTFLPMHQLGLQGMPRRVAMYDPQFQSINQLCTFGAFLLGASVLPFFINAIWSWSQGKPAGDNPWNAKTLEWTTASPPCYRKLGSVAGGYRRPLCLWGRASARACGHLQFEIANSCDGPLGPV